MKLSMVTYIYRIISIGIIIAPAIFNVKNISEITTSLLYIPLWMLFISLLCIYIDEKLVSGLKSVKKWRSSLNNTQAVLQDHTKLRLTD